MIISQEINYNLKKWSEGNDYLYNLLYIAWTKGIRTHACCAGHDNKESAPYISFIIDEKNISFFESFVGALEKIPNISVTINYRENDIIPYNDKKIFTVYCRLHNRCEVFYKLAEAIENPVVVETEKGKRLIKNLNNIKNMNQKEIENYLKEGILVSSTMSTITEEYIEYERKRKLLFYKLLKSKLNNNYLSQQDYIYKPPHKL